MTADFVLRPGRADDIGAVLDLWASSAENAHRPDDDATSVENLLARDPDSVVLAEADGELIGSVIIGWDGWRVHLYRLAVRDDWRRRGVGRALIEAGEQRSAEYGARRVDAIVLTDNALGASAWAGLDYAPAEQWTLWQKWLRR